MRYLLLFVIAVSMIPTIARSKNVIIASGHTEYPPFMWKEGGKIVGVGAELTSKIFEEIGIKVRCKYIGPWKRVQIDAQNGKLDIILGIYKNSDRTRYLAFPDESYASDPVVVYVKKGRPFPFSSWEDLIGKNGGAIIGDSFGQAFDSFARNELNVHRIVKIEHGLKMMVLERLDYLIYGLYPGKIRAIELGLNHKIEYLPLPVIEPKAYQAFSKKSKFLRYLQYFSNRVAELKADGTVSKLIQKYMNQLEKVKSQSKSQSVGTQ